MAKLNRTTKFAGIMGAAAIAALVALPSLAQVNPSPNIFNEPNYDGNPDTRTAPLVTPAPAVNPNPSIFSEFGLERPSTPQAQVSQSNSPALNPNPSIFSELGVDRAAPATTISRAASDLSSLDQQFMRMAAHSDQFEIRSSQMALQKSNNPEVRQYAEMMIQEHTQSTQLLTQLAAERGFTLPTEPSEFQQAVIDSLMPLSGVEFDRAYMAAQANGHIQTVGVFRSQIGQGRDAELRQFAAGLLPTIENHYEMASMMSGQFSAFDIRRPVQ
ncbi:DUF4142 domain-containing protein [Microcoleus sp. FACHB-1515]|uniref:DUF4142 domain-containing protein n=1 Tax=Cyanophyceae TaxID=3028117 RepID=UPI001685F31D|nr:DUF4142 domain-containing protein [Microcoleus sp. FACHB-1515]MBD2092013.1 DUF4142 domain-containing protein [Microcoleus sp. FACHB-1515]